jgi:hypothetical protein
MRKVSFNYQVAPIVAVQKLISLCYDFGGDCEIDCCLGLSLTAYTCVKDRKGTAGSANGHLFTSLIVYGSYCLLGLEIRLKSAVADRGMSNPTSGISSHSLIDTSYRTYDPGY